ncbi:MAG: stage V sporulation protein AD [Firmicutes bacterium]|nr:stage V sporulation protein AD [Bacillota bacterium]
MKIEIIHESKKKCNFALPTNKVETIKSGIKANQIDAFKNKKRQRGVIDLITPIYVVGRASFVGKKEKGGPLGEYFDNVVYDDKNGQNNFEQAEIQLMKDATLTAIKNANLQHSDIDMMLAGDLLNQLNVSNYAARDLSLPFLGMYSACSSFTECLIVGSAMIAGGQVDTAVCSVSSHFASAERQFRYPLEYGAQKPPYAQWTVTGGASMVLCNNPLVTSHREHADNRSHKGGVKITKAMIGRVIDLGTRDMSNMGAAMAPAFVDTLLRFFANTHTNVADYDLIVSGDLGKLGSDIASKLAAEKGVVLQKNYLDCGGIMYAHDQNAYQGGSGPACSGVVINSYILTKMLLGEYKKVLYLATGALMSPQSCFQGETIPCISHAVLFEV